MPAKFVKLGEPAHDAERQALRHIVEGLPDTYVVYGNPWLVDRGSVTYELDAVVVAPHAFYVVKIKSYRGTVEGHDYDWVATARGSAPDLRYRVGRCWRARFGGRHGAIASS